MARLILVNEDDINVYPALFKRILALTAFEVYTGYRVSRAMRRLSTFCGPLKSFRSIRNLLSYSRVRYVLFVEIGNYSGCTTLVTR